MSSERNGLNMNVLKGTLLDDDFGLMGGSPKEIDSLASLEALDNTPEDKDEPEVPETPETPESLEDTQEPVIPQNTSSNTKKEDELLKVFGANLSTAGLMEFNEAEFDKAEDKDKYFEEKAIAGFEKRAEEKFNEKYSELPPEIDRLIEFHKKGVPLTAILEADARVSSLEDIKATDVETDVNLQKDILKELFNSQGLSKERSEAKIKRYEDLGTLKDEASEGLETLVKLEKTERDNLIKTKQDQKLRADQERSDSLKAIETTINSSEEIIPGFKLTPEDKKILINGITKIAGTDKNGRQINALAKARIEDPKMDLKVAYFTLILKGDLSKLEKKATTAATRSLKSVVSSQEPLNSSGQFAGNHDNKNTAIDREVVRNSLKFLKRTG